jgi:RNA polymerase sigma factor for flagellar operon FliA
MTLDLRLVAPEDEELKMGTDEQIPIALLDEDESGIEEERQRLLAEQLPEVRCIAHRIHERLPRHVPFEDLVHAGVVGLIDALDKYDKSKHVLFGSYAKFRIRGAILDSLRASDWSPRDLRRQSRRVEEAHDKLRLDLGRHASEPELAGEMNITLAALQKLLSEISLLEIGSLWRVSPDGGKDEDLCESLPNERDESPLAQFLNSEMRELLARATSELPEKERHVLVLYYFEELSMKEVGMVLGIGESRVSQIHSIALLRLRTRMMELTASRVELARGAAASG